MVLIAGDAGATDAASGLVLRRCSRCSSLRFRLLLLVIVSNMTVDTRSGTVEDGIGQLQVVFHRDNGGSAVVEWTVAIAFAAAAVAVVPLLLSLG